jgi:hypothetical protein
MNGRDAIKLDGTIVIRMDGIQYLTSNQIGMFEIAA